MLISQKGTDTLERAAMAADVSERVVTLTLLPHTMATAAVVVVVVKRWWKNVCGEGNCFTFSLPFKCSSVVTVAAEMRRMRMRTLGRNEPSFAPFVLM